MGWAKNFCLFSGLPLMRISLPIQKSFPRSNLPVKI